jgi:hypothetical protein
VALPTLRRPLYVAEDAPAPLAYLCRNALVVPPSGPLAAFLLRLALWLASFEFVHRRIGAVAPGRVTVGVKA